MSLVIMKRRRLNSGRINTAGFTFTRATNAYLPDGSLFGSGVPRISYDSRYGQGLAVEEGTVNLLNGVTWEQGTIATADGANSASTTRIRTVGDVTVSAATSYTYSCSANYVVLAMAFYQSNGTYISNLTSSQQSMTFTTPALTSKMRVVLRRVDSGTIQASESTTAKPQLEQHAYPTTFIDGTRNAEPTSKDVSTLAAPFTVGFRCSINSVAKRQVTGQNPAIFCIQQAGGNAAAWAYHDTSAATWKFQTRNDSNTSTTSNPIADSNIPDGVNDFILRVRSSAADLFINGVKQTTLSTPNLPSAYATMYIGSQNGTLNYLNQTYYDGFIAGDLPDTLIAAITGQPWTRSLLPGCTWKLKEY